MLFSLLLLTCLYVDVLPEYLNHSQSMIIGTFAYISMVALACFTNESSEFTSKFFALAISIFALYHVVVEFQYMTSIALLSMTSVLGYTALITFGLLFSLKLISKFKHKPLPTFLFNGSMTLGTVLVYWHVASIDVVRESVLFFVPFSLLCLITIGQFLFRSATFKQSWSDHYA